MTPRCPTSPKDAEGEVMTVVGCGSTNVRGPDHEGVYECLDCGIWWDPKLELPEEETA